MVNSLQEYFFESLNLCDTQPAIEVKNINYTYNYLNSKIDAIGEAINKNGLKNKAIVVLNDHSFQSYAAILAINFTSNTILPIDISWPKNRIQAIIHLAKPAGIIISEYSLSIMDFIAENGLDKLTLIEATYCKTLYESSQYSSINVYEEIAYILFTSGSTGDPKGVPVKQKSLNAFIDYHKNTFDFCSADRFLQVYDITFDVAYFSFFVPLCFGACCCILDGEQSAPKNLLILKELMEKNITVVCMVPSVIHFSKKYLGKNTASKLRYSFFSGDRLFHSELVDWQQFVPNAEIHNYYGLTETTIHCTKYIWDKLNCNEIINDRVPIGKPFPGVTYEIISEKGIPINKGEIGELALGGVQVIENYLNHICPEKFICIKTKDNQSQYYFRTGDLVSVNETGDLIFYERADQQVKINGYRIELCEIQMAIKKITGLESRILKKQKANRIDYLEAFLVGKKTSHDDLIQQLELFIPKYMIPTSFKFLDQWPLNQNGKIDMLYLQNHTY